jgi:AraC-like DNA-binding protein
MPFFNWLQYTGEHLFKSHAGFHEFPYLSNSPELMVDGFASLAIVSHHRTAQTLVTENNYFKGEQHYCKIQDGLWLLASDFNFRKNILCKAVYEQTIPGDYYFLSFAVMEYPFPVNDKFTEFVSLVSTTCTFYKPGTGVNTFFYENTVGKVFNIGFTRAWALECLEFKNDAEMLLVKSFLNGETGFMNWLNIVPDAEKLSKEIWQYITCKMDKNGESIYLENTLKNILNNFFTSAFAENRVKHFTEFKNPDYASIASAEKLILINLQAPFMGVDAISKSVHVSPTKLKNIFKSVFGFSMLQYHKEKNMLLALQLIKNSTMQIRNIALITGYESASKFTAAFKKRFGFLPSQKEPTNSNE